MRVLESDECVDARECGGKAFGLYRLSQTGLRVPPFFVVVGISVRDLQSGASSMQRIIERARRLGSPGLAKGLAVRSSSAIEDSGRASYAGQFKTSLGWFGEEELAAAILDIAATRPREHDPIPVVVQCLITASYGGVGFSCNPVTLGRDEVVLNWLAGGAEAIVGGAKRGNIATFQQGDEGRPMDGGWPEFGEESSCQLVSGLRSMEALWELPVDCEWAIDEGGVLWWLQCRPIAALSSVFARPVKHANKHVIPARCQGHHKVALRLEAERLGVAMSPGHLIAADARGREEPPVPLLTSEEDSTLSIVLIHPERVDGEVIRRFANRDALQTTVGEVLRIGARKAWQPVAICQEIWRPYLTGIATREGGALVIEMARGHFVPKGVVTTSRVVMETSGRVVACSVRNQSEFYDLVGGAPIVREMASDLTEEEIVALAEVVRVDLGAVLEIPGRLVEFGIGWKEASRGFAYLIDIVDPAAPASLLSIHEGVVSRGRVCGRLRDVRHISSGEATLHRHFHSSSGAGGSDAAENTILFCRRPDLALLDMVHAQRPETLGIVFEEAALLSHLAVLLREYGIPAVEVGFKELPVGQIVELDAETPGLSANERIRLR